MRKPGFRKLIASALVIIVIGALTFYGVLSWQRYEAIRDVLAKAQAERAGGRIEALTSYLGSADVDLEEKNRVIWVLGELRDERAIGMLRRLHVAQTCDHSRFVCQREVRKAIAKVNGEVPNPFFWPRLPVESAPS
jgi:hypothetical protein